MRHALGISLAIVLGSVLFAAQLVIPRGMGESWPRSILTTIAVDAIALALTGLLLLCFWGLGMDFS